MIVSDSRPSNSRAAVRIILGINFVLLVVVILVGAIAGDKVDRSLKAARLDEMIIWTTQVWVAVSTLFATGIVLRDYVRKWRGALTDRQAIEALEYDFALLAAWWVVLGGLGLYGLMLGTAG